MVVRWLRGILRPATLAVLVAVVATGSKYPSDSSVSTAMLRPPVNTKASPVLSFAMSRP